MLQAAGLDGVWVCVRNPSHEFSEDPDDADDELEEPEEPKASRSRSGKSAPKQEQRPGQERRCPKCGRVAKEDDLGPYCDNQAHGTYRVPETQGEYWLAKIGISAPPSAVPQSSQLGDGSACLQLGSVKHGGGKKSGRARKKPVKKTAHPWFQT